MIYNWTGLIFGSDIIESNDEIDWVVQC